MRICFFFLAIIAGASEVPDFNHLSNTRGATIFLSTERSGSNLISTSLAAITRKPISWLHWKTSVFEPNSERKQQPAYNRLHLPLITDQPLLYRTHGAFEELRQIPSYANRLIFMTRNPKELIFRKFSLQSPQEAPDLLFVEDFLKKYLTAFEMYEAWDENTRMLVFYEDFIGRGDEILLELLSFMGEKLLFFEDYRMHREEYLARLLESYKEQHQKVAGGLSSRDGPTAIYYTKNAPMETLLQIDAYIERKAPLIWKKYLKRFSTH